ncbi:hypothetical protein GN956_G24948 [Arapaima gigas]
MRHTAAGSSPERGNTQLGGLSQRKVVLNKTAVCGRSPAPFSRLHHRTPNLQLLARRKSQAKHQVPSSKTVMSRKIQRQRQTCAECLFRRAAPGREGAKRAGYGA